MSYTNTELVRRHISFDESAVGVRSDYPVTFVDQEWINLPGRNLRENSVQVKAVRDYSPVFEDVAMVQGILTLSNKCIMVGSVTVASDSSLGRIYRENVDYAVDCLNGVIRLISGGAIPDEGKVSVWYYYYSIYVEGGDYSIDYTAGMIRRLVNSDIQPGQTVLVDFELSSNRIDDELIAAAVSEANAVVEKQIDPSGRFGADMSLQTAATYLAVSVLCRMAAAGDLAAGGKGYQTAAAWLSLGENYRGDYEQLLKTFRPQAGRLSGPTNS